MELGCEPHALGTLSVWEWLTASEMLCAFFAFVIRVVVMAAAAAAVSVLLGDIRSFGMIMCMYLVFFCGKVGGCIGCSLSSRR